MIILKIKPMKQLFLVAAAFSFIASGCHQSKTVAATAQQRGMPGYNAPLTDIRWMLVELNGKAIVQAPDDKQMYIRFVSNGQRLEGNGGCNTLLGKFELGDHERIKIIPGSTLMACAEAKMVTEKDFTTVLNTADSYFISGDTLQLFRARMAPLAKFEAKYYTR